MDKLKALTYRLTVGEPYAHGYGRGHEIPGTQMGRFIAAVGVASGYASGSFLWMLCLKK